MDPRSDESVTRARLLVATTAVVIAFVLGVVVRASTVGTAELDLFRWVNGWPDALGIPIWVVMQAGTVVGGIVVPVVVMGLLRGRRGAIAGAVAPIGAWAIARVAKAWVDRGRPVDYLGEVDVHFDRVVSGLGYPSGHCAVAFAAATLVAGFVPRRWAAVAYGLATVVAIGRLYFGAHLPLDLVGGAAIGIACGTLARFLVPDPPATVASTVSPAEVAQSRGDEPRRAGGPLAP